MSKDQNDQEEKRTSIVQQQNQGSDQVARNPKKEGNPPERSFVAEKQQTDVTDTLEESQETAREENRKQG